MDRPRPSRRLAAKALGLLTVAVCAAQAVTLVAFRPAVSGLKLENARLHASVSLTDVFPEALRRTLEEGASIYLRVQAQLWEDRAVFDRKVGAPAVAAFRIARNPSNGEVAVIDAAGHLAVYENYPDRVSVDIVVGPESLLDRGGHYYIDTTTTLGALSARDLEETGKAVFGDAFGLGQLGRFLLSTVLEVSDYMQGTTERAKSRTFTEKELGASRP